MNLDRMGVAPFKSLLRDIMVLPEEWVCETCGALRNETPAGVFESLWAEGFTAQRIEDVQCECGAQAAAKQRGLLFDAGLPHPKAPETFETFQPREGAEPALQAALRFAHGPGTSVLVLMGAPGSGKTHLLEAIGREALRRSESVRYEYAPVLLDDLRASYSDDAQDSTNAVMDRVNRPRVLLLDDIGVGAASQWVQERLTRIIDDRYRSGTSWRLAVAMNMTRAETEAKLGSRIASRLWDVESGRVETVALTCADYRAQRPTARLPGMGD